MTVKVRKVTVDCTQDEDRAKQSFRDECDMNNIVSRINKTGFVPLEAQASLRRQIYGDFSQSPQSLEEAYAIVGRADAAFAALPAALRERFEGPAGLLAFVENPDNLKEAHALGLIAKTQPSPISAPNSGASVLPANGVENAGQSATSTSAAPAAGVVAQ